MYQIDKEKFGAFVAQLRKEKGLMQKELAEKLFVSDKAVSKWERGLSIPDVSLLIPLADALGVTVTELLECSRLPGDGPMDSHQTDEMLKKIIAMSGEEHRSRRPSRLRGALVLGAAVIFGALEVWALTLLGTDLQSVGLPLLLPMGLMAAFGVYFWVFAREQLPAYYDENKISFFADGPVRMNLPGVYFNNRNWPHILRALRVWSAAGPVFLPGLYLLLERVLPEQWRGVTVAVILAVVLGGLFIPVVLLARRYGSEEETQRYGAGKNVALVISLLAIVALCLLPVLTGGIATSGSGIRMGWSETGGRDRWSATYMLHNGFRQRSFDPGDESLVLWADIQSSSGRIGITVTDGAGRILFSREDIGTDLLQIPLEGKVTVRITGEDHRGSFSLWLE